MIHVLTHYQYLQYTILQLDTSYISHHTTIRGSFTVIRPEAVWTAAQDPQIDPEVSDGQNCNNPSALARANTFTDSWDLRIPPRYRPVDDLAC